MIRYIKGRVNSIDEGFIILEQSGIGYQINMPSSSLYKITEGDENVCIYTYMSVKEDGISLFGFLTRAEREMFELLTGVSGIGPKGALGILSSISVPDLKLAIEAEDSKLIAGAKGIGLKTAQKIVLELKGKLEKTFLSDPLTAQNLPLKEEAASSEISSALEVLTALGFSRSAAFAAVNTIKNAADLSAEDIVNEALKVIE